MVGDRPTEPVELDTHANRFAVFECLVHVDVQQIDINKLQRETRWKVAITDKLDQHFAIAPQSGARLGGFEMALSAFSGMCGTPVIIW